MSRASENAGLALLLIVVSGGLLLVLISYGL